MQPNLFIRQFLHTIFFFRVIHPYVTNIFDTHINIYNILLQYKRKHPRREILIFISHAVIQGKERATSDNNKTLQRI